MRRLLVIGARFLRSAALAAAIGCVLAPLASAQPEYDEYGLKPDGGGGGDVDWPEPDADGGRPEPIAPDEEQLDPFDERAIELEPEVEIAPDYEERIEPPPPVQEKPAEPLLPPVEQILKDGPGTAPAKADPNGLDAQEKAREAEKADPEQW
ncbi:MAG TPA: hypothetical protein VEL28_16515 [Candidatus Binatia bacterium]|nr:hypothetical protein [Candidatus Binatia bacterium]